MLKLAKMPNIGKILEKRLLSIGITTSGELIEAGAEEAFIRLNILEGDTCLHTLYALEGAVQNIKKTNISPQRKTELKQFFYESYE